MSKLLLSLLLATAVLAQFDSATLTGIVTDPAGSLVPDASVRAVNEATNIEASAITNTEGRYVFPNLRPGSYKIITSAAGFKQFVSSGVVLQVNQAGRLDVQLTVGAITEQVSVTGEAPVLETESASRGAVIDRTKMVELPLNGRDYNQLALLSPGVLAPTPRLQSVGFRGAFNVNGNRAFQNAFQLDGVDNTSYSNSFRGLNVQVIQPSVEALEEFKIQTNAYSAEFGRSAGALINAVIRSGSNKIHGSAYEFIRNSQLDASNFFANKAGLNKPFRQRNQFGGSFGAPIRKDHTFIFGDYEGLRDAAAAIRFSSVPKPIWKQGMFATPIWNPYNPNDTGADFRIPATPDCNDGAGNCWRIPVNLIDPVGQKVLLTAPGANTLSPNLDNNFVAAPVDRNRTNQFDVRVDHNFSSKVNAFGRYSFSKTNFFRPAPRPGLAEGSFNDTFGTADLKSQQVAGGLVWVIGPALVSDTRFGYAMGDYYQLPPNFGTPCPGDLIGLKNSVTDTAICGGMPVFNFPGGTLRRLGRTTSVPQFQTPRSMNLRESIAWTRGVHSLRLGGELLNVDTGIRDVSSLLGQFDFTGRFTGVNGLWENSLADLLLGFPSRYQQDSNTTFEIYQHMYFLFAQDDWKITRKLTLNIGLRYEFATPPRERQMKWANFDSAAHQFISAKEGSLRDEALIAPDRNDFAPRFGFAFSATPKTVIRGAYGVFYNHANRLGREGLLGIQPSVHHSWRCEDRRIGRSSFGRRPFPAAGRNTSRLRRYRPRESDNGRAQGTGPESTDALRSAVQLRCATGTVEDLVFDIAYVGNRGKKLPSFRNLNPNVYSFNAQGAAVVGVRELDSLGLRGDIQVLENLGISNYNSLQMKLERRFANGFTMLASYTFGKALTDSVDHLSTSGVGNGVDVGEFKEPQDPHHRRLEYGPAEFDVDHRFVLSGVWQLPFGRNKTCRQELVPWRGPASRRVGSSRQSSAAQTGPRSDDEPVTVCEYRGRTAKPPEPHRQWHVAGVPAHGGPLVRYRRICSTDAIRRVRSGFAPNQIFGNSGVGIVRGPGLQSLDFNLAKDFCDSGAFRGAVPRGVFQRAEPLRTWACPA